MSTPLVTGTCRLLKKDGHRLTAKALQLLKNIESRIHCCDHLLLQLSDASYFDIQYKLATLHQGMDKVTCQADTVTSQKKTLLARLDELEAQVKLYTLTSCGPVKVDTENHYQPPVEQMDAIAQVTLLLGIICNVIFGIGTSGANFIMNGLSLLLYLAFRKSDGTLSAVHQNVMAQIPSTIGVALSKFQLATKTIIYAICACHCTYAPSYPVGSQNPVHPNYCSHSLTPETRCTESLLKTSTSGECSPRKIFIYHDFKDYLASLVSCPDIEAIMDSACDDLCALLSSPPHYVKNPFEAQFLRTFCGPDGHKLFVDRGDEGRYAFSLHVDFFNPEGMKI
ncbi:hypothetical protein PISMIDRAFT_16012 [Pisolithus microcarpus 441]|uniref:Unplaced genomic scaffold scaffold_182, whole genome shotgun sequence n=1 Tax=Pisolithus microcarpus 441 TaxID=765257 RepID=A0A0C9Z1G6_9AGAM|nr:hypothetical protein PISMIDRAFT_16012 [Pisolithus microcarpus 441]